MHASKLVFMRPALIAGLGLAALVSTTSASARSFDTDTRSIEVRYGDLDLSAPAGVKRLESRVRSAAKRICEYPGLVGLDARKTRSDCMDDTMANANRDMQVAINEHGSQRYASRATIGVGRR